MSYTIGWVVKDHIVEAVTEGDVTLDDFENACHDMVVILAEVETPRLYLIVDIRLASSINFTLDELLRSATLQAMASHARLGYVAYISDRNPFFSQLTYLLLHAANLRGDIFTSREDALDYFADKGAPLPPTT